MLVAAIVLKYEFQFFESSKYAPSAPFQLTTTVAALTATLKNATNNAKKLFFKHCILNTLLLRQNHVSTL
jgi:hypothetical protein